MGKPIVTSINGSVIADEGGSDMRFTALVFGLMLIMTIGGASSAEADADADEELSPQVLRFIRPPRALASNSVFSMALGIDTNSSRIGDSESDLAYFRTRISTGLFNSGKKWDFGVEGFLVLLLQTEDRERQPQEYAVRMQAIRKTDRRWSYGGLMQNLNIASEESTRITVDTLGLGVAHDRLVDQDKCVTSRVAGYAWFQDFTEHEVPTVAAFDRSGDFTVFRGRGVKEFRKGSEAGWCAIGRLFSEPVPAQHLLVDLSAGYRDQRTKGQEFASNRWDVRGRLGIPVNKTNAVDLDSRKTVLKRHSLDLLASLSRTDFENPSVYGPRHDDDELTFGVTWRRLTFAGDDILSALRDWSFGLVYQRVSSPIDVYDYKRFLFTVGLTIRNGAGSRVTADLPPDTEGSASTVDQTSENSPTRPRPTSDLPSPDSPSRGLGR